MPYLCIIRVVGGPSGRPSSSGAGSGSPSSSPTPGERARRRGSSADSPREGGFLEGRVRQLWVRLAQMEAEKLKSKI
jgi:hypothetical protein